MRRLLKSFRSKQSLIWKQFAAELDGEFIEGASRFDTDSIAVKHDNWEIIIDTVRRKKKRFTRLRAPYVNRDGFKFKIFTEKFLLKPIKHIGMQDIKVGHTDFDSRFIIQGNDSFKLETFFDNELIRQLLSVQPTLTFSIHLDENWSQDPFSEGVSELVLEVVSIPFNIHQLESLYILFAEVLQHLCHIGSAYEDDPELSLRPKN